MRMKMGLALASLLALLPLAPRAEEIRMIGESVMYSDKTITSNVINSRTHRTLIKAMKSVKLEQPLMRHGSYTIFAPDDAAFAALPEAFSKRLFERVNRDQMARVLACHIVAGNEKSGKRLSELVEEGKSIELQTLGGCMLHVTRKDGAIFVTGTDGAVAQITALDVAQSNGMLQIIDRVLTSVD
jgi:uncharacterized surface protein with fasciclin (FAS1) repeats